MNKPINKLRCPGWKLKKKKKKRRAYSGLGGGKTRLGREAIKAACGASHTSGFHLRRVARVQMEESQSSSILQLEHGRGLHGWQDGGGREGVDDSDGDGTAQARFVWWCFNENSAQDQVMSEYCSTSALFTLHWASAPKTWTPATSLTQAETKRARAHNWKQ